jgi:hypothetical protein
MGNRSPSQVAARWEKCLDPRLAKGAFTEQEDRIIIKYVEQNGAQNWPALSDILAKRSPKQCRERWCNHLSPSVSHIAWTRDEDALIFDNYQQIGPKWSMIARALPGRTDNAVKNRWNSSISKRVQIHADGRRSILPKGIRNPRPPARQLKPNRPPPAKAAAPAPESKVVPVDLSQLQPWQVRVLCQFNIIEQHGQVQQSAELTSHSLFRSPQPESPESPFKIAPTSPFGQFQTVPTPGRIFTLDDGSHTPMSPGQLFHMNVFE